MQRLIRWGITIWKSLKIIGALIVLNTTNAAPDPLGYNNLKGRRDRNMETRETRGESEGDRERKSGTGKVSPIGCIRLPESKC